MAKVLVTDNGSHSPEKWAMLSAEVIFPLDGVEGAERVFLARQTQLSIAQAFLKPYADIQDAEWDGLVSDPKTGLEAPLDPVAEAEAALVGVLQVVAGTPWEAHFARPEVQAAVLSEVASHIATIKQIERDWAVADFADHPDVKAFVAAQSAA